MLGDFFYNFPLKSTSFHFVPLNPYNLQSEILFFAH